MRRQKRVGSYLQLRGRTYYFRIAIPLGPKGSTGNRRELIASLKTQDYDIARRIALLLAGQVMLINLKEGHNMPNLSTPQLNELINGYFQKIYANQVIKPTVPAEEADRQEMLEIAQADEAGIYDQYAHYKRRRFEEIQQLVTSAGLVPVEDGSPEHIHLAEGLYQADMHAAELWSAKLLNPRHIIQPQGQFAPPSLQPSQLAPQADSSDNIGSAGAIKVKALITKFAAHKEKKGRWREETRKDNLIKLQMFADFIGEDRYIHTIMPQDFAAYDDALSRMPRNMNKMPRYRHMSLKEAAKKACEGDMVTPQTASKHYDNVRWMFDHAVDMMYLKHTIVPNLRKDNSYVKAERLIFTSEELASIFGSPLFNQYKFYKKAGEFWVPLLGAYTGARLNELVGLEVADVIRHNGFNYLFIRPNSCRNLKNKTSTRLIPIHPDLIEAGFLEYVDRMHAKRQRTVFPDLHKNAKPADAMTKKFANLLVAVGLKKKGQRGGHCFHSLRHTFATQLSNLGVERELRMGLMGHAIPDTQSDYVKVFPASRTEPEIRKLSYGLDLASLLVVNNS